MRIVYFGSGEFGRPTLEALSVHHQVNAIITQPDRPAGRRRTSTPTPIASWAHANTPAVQVFKPADVNEPAIAQQVRDIDADAFVVIAFGQKLGARVLDDRFALNLHASRLPRWRGAAPINYAILAGDSTTGNSVITLADRMDEGDILAQSSNPIGRETTAGNLHDELAQCGPALVFEVLERFETGTLETVAQDDSLVTLAPKLARSDAWVDFTQGAEACRKRINGLSPWPGVSVRFQGASLKLVRARVEAEPGPGSSQQQSREPGVIADPVRGLVACGPGPRLELLEVQPSGKRVMQWRDFARGRTLDAESMLEVRTRC